MPPELPKIMELCMPVACVDWMAVPVGFVWVICALPTCVPATKPEPPILRVPWDMPPEKPWAWKWGARRLAAYGRGILADHAHAPGGIGGRVLVYRAAQLWRSEGAGCVADVGRATRKIERAVDRSDAEAIG